MVFIKVHPLYVFIGVDGSSFWWKLILRELRYEGDRMHTQNWCTFYLMRVLFSGQVVRPQYKEGRDKHDIIPMYRDDVMPIFPFFVPWQTFPLILVIKQNLICSKNSVSVFFCTHIVINYMLQFNRGFILYWKHLWLAKVYHHMTDFEYLHMAKIIPTWNVDREFGAFIKKNHTYMHTLYSIVTKTE